MNHGDSCPFLGQKHDQNTSYNYPSRGTYCHKINPPQRVQVTHQAERCLKSEYEQCPIYSQGELNKLSEDIIVIRKSKLNQKRLWSGISVILALLIVASLFFFEPVLPLEIFEMNEEKTLEEINIEITITPSSLPVSTLALTQTNPPQPSLIPTRTPTPITISTATSTSTTIARTPFPTVGPGLTTPFGPDKSYLIHSVRGGESFAFLENKYATTTEVIEAINTSENHGLWSGRKLVIMPGQASPTDLPKFEVVFLDRDMDLIEIAGMYSASIEDIRYYNSLGLSTETIPAGRWLIIPVEQ